MKVNGIFNVKHIRDGNIIEETEIYNSATTDGLNKLLDAAFNYGAQESDWYIGLIDNNGYSGVLISDTMGWHLGWSEIQAYDEIERPYWDRWAANNSQITPYDAGAVFTMNSGCTVKGFFMSSGSAKGGDTGTLWATSLFSSPRSLNSADTLQIKYSIIAE